MTKNVFFFDGCFNKNRIKNLISWSLKNCGEHTTITLLENLKNVGFIYATQAGVSLGIDDLKIPLTKPQLILDSDIQIHAAQITSKQGYLTSIEKFQQLIDTWHRTSEILKQNVIQYFQMTDILNPVYMMAFSGARGNISQVRQLVGMRGLMSDPQGQILDFPIKSNFREGLTLTEYIISCYGARKGLVDTALKTANSGYLTRRLVDVSHNIVICEFDCKTKKSVVVTDLIENQKVIIPLQNRLIGRVLAENIFSTRNSKLPKFNSISKKNSKQNVCFEKEVGRSEKFTRNQTSENSKAFFSTKLSLKFLPKSQYTFTKRNFQKITNNARLFALVSNLLSIHFLNTPTNKDPLIATNEIYQLPSRNLISIYYFTKIEITNQLKFYSAKKILKFLPSEYVNNQNTEYFDYKHPEINKETNEIKRDFIEFKETDEIEFSKTKKDPSDTDLNYDFNFDTSKLEPLAGTDDTDAINKFKNLTLIQKQQSPNVVTRLPNLLDVKHAPEEDYGTKNKNIKPNSDLVQKRFNSLINFRDYQHEVFTIQAEILEFWAKEFSVYRFVIFLKHINFSYSKKKVIGYRNQEISLKLAIKIASVKKQVLVRSPLTCDITNSMCQLCYGWSLAHGKLVSLGETVGIIAAQSIGEPGTQLTMRTFHTGGVFSGDIMSEIRAPFSGRIQFSESFQGMLIRTPHGKIAFLTKVPGTFEICPSPESIENNKNRSLVENSTQELSKKNSFEIPALTILFVRNHEYVTKTQLIAEFSSVSTATERRLKSNYDLKTEIEGEVYFKDVVIIERYTVNEFGEEVLVSRKTGNLGSIWIISGKIYNQSTDINLFPKSRDIVNETSVLGQYQNRFPYNGRIPIASQNTKIKSLQVWNSGKFFKYENFTTGLKQEPQARAKNDFSEKNWKSTAQKSVFFKALNSIANKNINPTALFHFSTTGTPENNGTKDKLHKKQNNVLTSQSIPSCNSDLLLNNLIISIPIQCIQYRKIGYFFSFLDFQKPHSHKVASEFYFSCFFISTSLQQEFQKFNKLKSHFYFQSFPRQYQTQTGGIVVYDDFYESQELECGEIFWIPEQKYRFSSHTSFFWENNDKMYPELRKLPIAMVENGKKVKKKSKKKLNTTSIQQYTYSRKYINQTNSIHLYCNSQGKISNFYSKLYGCIEITSTISSPLCFDKSKLHSNNFGKLTSKNGNSIQKKWGLPKFATKHVNIWKPYYENYKFSILGFKRNPMYFILCFRKLNSHSHQKNSNINFFQQKNKLYCYALYCVRKNKKLNFSVSHQKNDSRVKIYRTNRLVVKNNRVSFLQPKFPWFQLNTSHVFKPATSFSEIHFSTHNSISLIAYCEKYWQRQRKKKYQAILQFYNAYIKFYPYLVKTTRGTFQAKHSLSFSQNFNLPKKTLLHHSNLSRVAGLKNSTLWKDFFSIHIKPGWVYFPTIGNQVISKYKHILSPGKNLCDTIIFDQYSIYVECLVSPKIIIQQKKCILAKNKKLQHSLHINSRYTEFFGKKFLKKSNVSQIFLKTINKVFWNIYTTLFFKKNLTGSLILMTQRKRKRKSNGRYISLIIEKYIQRNSTISLSLLLEKTKHLKQNSNLLNKTYNLKIIYFLKNENFQKTILNTKNSVLLQTYVSKKNSFYFELNNFKKTKNENNQYLCFQRQNLFLPKFFVLIRKLTSYSLIQSFQYKRLLAQKNNFSSCYFTNSEKIQKNNVNFTQLLCFNKQNTTCLFFSFPSVDFCVKPYLKHDKDVFSKSTTLLKFSILINIPNKYPTKNVKIQLISQPARNILNPHILPFLAMLFNQKNWNKQKLAKIFLSLNFQKKLRDLTLFSLNKIPSTNTNYYFFTQRNTLNFNLTPYLNISFFSKLTLSNETYQCNPQKNSKLIQTKVKISNVKNENQPWDFTKVQTFANSCFTTENSLFPEASICVTKFFSPYEGEILKLQTDSKQGQSYVILTSGDQASFSLANLSAHEILASKMYFGKKKYIDYGTQVSENLAIPESGRIIQIEKTKIIVRKAQSMLFSAKGLLFIYDNDLVEKNTLILRLFYQRLKTGDIVQGIPKIEQLFEARKTAQGRSIKGGIHQQLRWLFGFYKKKKKYDIDQAARRSLQKIQQIIVNNIGQVYQSQGVRIDEKHLEIIVRQMTSKVLIIDNLPSRAGQLYSFDGIENVNKTRESEEHKIKYEPIIMGITRKSLDTNSFISEASFQETTRILTRSAIQRKTDFLQGLKENVILGYLIPAGTGFSGKIMDSNKPQYLHQYQSYSIFRKFLLEIVSQNKNYKTIVTRYANQIYRESYLRLLKKPS